MQAEVPSGVVANKGRFFIHAKRWAVKRRVAGVGNSCRLAKNYEHKAICVNLGYT